MVFFPIRRQWAFHFSMLLQGDSFPRGRNYPQDFSLKLFTKGTEHCFHGHNSNFKLNLKLDFLLTYQPDLT